MNQVQFLQQQIAGLPPMANELRMEVLVANYLAAKAQMEQFIDAQALAKGEIVGIIEQTGITKWDTKSGKVIKPADATIISYDAKALDALAASNKTLARQILPHRNESVRSSGVRITGK